jgi:GNAT superfamily N-acetyltransferase
MHRVTTVLREVRAFETNHMSLTDAERARYCEAMLYDYEPEWRPAGIAEIERPDVRAWKRPGWPAGHSRVAYAKWSTDDAERCIDELLAFFGDAQFTWYVGPSSTPADLEARLVRRGLVVQERPRLMTASLPLSGEWRDAGVRIVDVADRETARLSLELAHHEGDELERSLAERMAYLALPTRRGGYVVAYEGDVPVANAGYRFSSDGGSLYLTGAEVVEQHRRRGIYQSLVAHRARMAQARGCAIVSIIANRNTSAPILARHGFVDHGEQPRLAPRDAHRRTRRAVF